MLVARALLFNLLFFAWTALLAVLCLPVLLLPRAAIFALAKFWARGMTALLRWIVGLDWQVRGRENVPDGPLVVAVKHQSFWDTMIYALLFDQPAIVYKRELNWVPLLGWFFRRADMIPVDRGGGGKALRALMRKAQEVLADGRVVVIAPEGTRTAPGRRVPYQPGIAALYGKLGAAVLPVALNSGLFWGRRGFLKRPGMITVEMLPPIAPGLERSAFMTELQTRIETATTRLENTAKARFATNGTEAER